MDLHGLIQYSVSPSFLEFLLLTKLIFLWDDLIEAKNKVIFIYSSTHLFIYCVWCTPPQCACKEQKTSWLGSLLPCGSWGQNTLPQASLPILLLQPPRSRRVCAISKKKKNSKWGWGLTFKVSPEHSYIFFDNCLNGSEKLCFCFGIFCLFWVFFNCKS